mgnify:FL=1
MAVTKIWTIKDSLQRVLDYAANPDKTEYDALAQTLHYAENDAKTKLNESAQLVTGIHCRADHAWEDMRAVQEHFGKTDGVVALHAYQASARGKSPRSNAMKSAWRWHARSGASDFRCWSPHT